MAQKGGGRTPCPPGSATVVYVDNLCTYMFRLLYNYIACYNEAGNWVSNDCLTCWHIGTTVPLWDLRNFPDTDLHYFHAYNFTVGLGRSIYTIETELVRPCTNENGSTGSIPEYARYVVHRFYSPSPWHVTIAIV